jgi:sugar O-acyltransferase (sialic acid O-acetyltransferase NeuD family)
MSLPKNANVILWGASGQARVVKPILEANGHRIVHIFDNEPAKSAVFPSVPQGTGWTSFVAWYKYTPKPVGFVVCIGGIRGQERVDISTQLTDAGAVPVTIVHEKAWVASSAKIDPGAQILTMAAVCENVRLGRYTIINTNASIDHDSVVGIGVHIMPGATIAGECTIGNFASIGSNATILPRIRIGELAVVGAGAVVTQDVPPGVVVIGSPARPISSINTKQ